MITFHPAAGPAVQCRDISLCTSLTSDAVWIDLFEPSAEEEKAVEAGLGINVPTREEMQGIEVSNRLYEEDGALFMTAPVLVNADNDAPICSPITFILHSSDKLLTVRYADPLPFRTVRAQRDSNPANFASGQLVFKVLIDAIVQRLADILENVGGKLDVISSELFKPSRRTQRTLNASQSKVANKIAPGATPAADYGDVLVRLGRCSDLISKARESGVGLGRLISFLGEDRKELTWSVAEDLCSHLRIVVVDLSSLTDHSSFLSSNINFLLDMTLGLINIEQNGIIKIVSVAAVVFLPPTLVASVYGMNFKAMPELDWHFGYPFALVLMVISAVLPYMFFKRKGWL